MAGMNSTVIDYLDPSVMYEISVTSHNIYGESLESMKVRTLTSLVQVGSKNGTGAPDLPDVKECCRQKGIYHNRYGISRKYLDSSLIVKKRNFLIRMSFLVS